MKRLTTYGFTLIELMVAVVIIGVLAAIAYPTYTKQMIQTRRSDAQIALTKAANLQEKYYSDCGTYAYTLEGTAASRICGTAASNYTNGILALNNNASATILSDNSHYVITLVAPTSSTGGCPITRCFIIQAAPATKVQGGSGLQLGNGNLRIDSLGNKTWDKANNSSYSARWTDK